MRQTSILVVVDPAAGAAQPALERAAWLAQRAGSTLELLACDFDPDLDRGHVSTVWVQNGGPREQLLERHRRTLEELAAPLRRRGLTVTVEVVWEHPFEHAIVRKAADPDCWLVVKDTHHHTLLQRTLLTNVDWHLIRECPAPLLLVKDRKLASEPNILAAVDPVNDHDKPAALDDRIFNQAAELARLARGHLHVVHSFATPMGAELPPDVAKVIAGEHRAAMAKFLDSHPVLAGRSHLYEGLAHDCLRLAAKEHAADFVVMGAVARRGLERLFIGSTAERVLDSVNCSVLTLKAKGFKTVIK